MPVGEYDRSAHAGKQHERFLLSGEGEVEKADVENAHRPNWTLTLPLAPLRPLSETAR